MLCHSKYVQACRRPKHICRRRQGFDSIWRFIREKVLGQLWAQHFFFEISKPSPDCVITGRPLKMVSHDGVREDVSFRSGWGCKYEICERNPYCLSTLPRTVVVPEFAKRSCISDLVLEYYGICIIFYAQLL